MSAKILVVEDDPSDAKLIVDALKELEPKLDVFVETTGVDAVLYVKGEVKYANREKYPFPDVILLDLDLPTFDGFEFLEWLRREPSKRRRTPVVVVTGANDPGTLSRAYLMGANSVITKSSNWTQFTRALRDVKRFWAETGEGERADTA